MSTAASTIPRVSERSESAQQPGRRRRAGGTGGSSTQLPSGRHGLSRAFVVEHQRERIVEAVVEVVDSHGYPAAAVERIASHAGVSRRTFYEQFSGKEDAFLQTYDLLASGLIERLRDAAEAASAADDATIDAALRAALAVLLDDFAAEPTVAHLLVVDVLVVGPAAIERRDAHMRTLVELLQHAAVTETGAPLPALAAEGLVGAVYDVVYKRVAAGETEQLPELLDDLHAFARTLFRRDPDPRSA